MKLWTYQSLIAVEELLQTGNLTANWERYSRNDHWKNAYLWMSIQMEKRKIELQGNAPIWAWHSCKSPYAPPTMDTVVLLLSLNERKDGIKLIEFECPDKYALLSKYGKWNDLIDTIWKTKPPDDFRLISSRGLFIKNVERMREGDEIQAVLPFLELSWVNDIRKIEFEDLEAV